MEGFGPLKAQNPKVGRYFSEYPPEELEIYKKSIIMAEKKHGRYVYHCEVSQAWSEMAETFV